LKFNERMMSKSIRDNGKRDVVGRGEVRKRYNDMRHHYLPHVRKSVRFALGNTR